MRLKPFFVAAALVSASLAAHAGTVNITLTSTDATFTFSAPDSPVPYIAEPGVGWELYPITSTGTLGSDTLAVAFYDAGGAIDGGFAYEDLTNFSIDYFTGPQLYTGADGAPTLDIGTFSLNDVTGGTATITIADSSAVTPEPSSFLLLGTGLLGALGMMRKRFAA